MNKQTLYLMIYQIISQEKADAPLIDVFDFDRNLSINIGRNSDTKVSYINLEFAGVKARYLTSFIFDGSGDNGCSLSNFAMPKLRISHLQKALVMLACLEFLITNKVLENMNSWEYFCDRVTYDFSNGNYGLKRHYDRLRAVAADYSVRYEKEASLHRSSKAIPEHTVVYF